MVVRQAVHLYDGEVSISRTGIFTRNHVYRHPAIGREVVLCGMLHVGDKQFFEDTKSILASCDVVLYEPIGPQSSGGNTVDGPEIAFQDNDQNSQLLCLLASYYTLLQFKTGHLFAQEGKHFAKFYGIDNWHCADLLPDIGEEDNDVSVVSADTMYNKMRRIPKASKDNLESLLFLNMCYLLDGSFTKKDFAKTLIALDMEMGGLRKFFESALSMRQRDKHCMNVFDRIVKAQKPGRVGIKFGVAHVSNQCKLLEKRGYELVKTQKVCAIRF